MKRHAFSGSIDPFHHPIQNQVFFSYEDYIHGRIKNQYIYMAYYMVIISITLTGGDGVQRNPRPCAGHSAIFASEPKIMNNMLQEIRLLKF